MSGERPFDETVLQASKIETEASKKTDLIPVEQIIPGIRTEDMMSLEEMEAAQPPEGNFDTIGNAFGDNYAQHLDVGMGYIEPKREILDMVFKGQIVIELGPGGNSLRDYTFFDQAQGYVAVEPYRFSNILRDWEKYPRQRTFESNDTLPCSVSNDDMLTFLRRLPDNSVSIVMSGIDAAILNQEYRHDVAREMKRVLHQDGTILANHTFLRSEPLLETGDTPLRCAKWAHGNLKLFSQKELRELGPKKEEVLAAFQQAGLEPGDTTMYTGYVEAFRQWKSMRLIEVMNSKNPKEAFVRHTLETTDLLTEAQMFLNYDFVALLEKVLAWAKEIGQKTGDDTLFQEVKKRYETANEALEKSRAKFLDDRKLPPDEYRKKREKNRIREEQKEEKLMDSPTTQFWVKQKGLQKRGVNGVLKEDERQEITQTLQKEYMSFILSRDIVDNIENNTRRDY